MNPTPQRRAPPRSEPWFPMQALSNVLVIAGAVCLTAFVVVLTVLDGWHYYTTPLRVRGYVPAHRLLRPSGLVGQLFGIVGLGLMLATLLYSLRKKSRKLARVGSLKIWLEAHIFCGIVGPAFITLHTSFKFNGIISIAYWSMVLVVGSGFVGRYLFVRIPRTIRGTELSLAEIEERIAELQQNLAGSALPPSLARLVDRFATATCGEGGLRFRRRLAALRKQLSAAGVDAGAIRSISAHLSERATLARRIATLSRTRRLFELWHVFHKPLVYVMLAIAALHVAIAIYFGYALVRL